jgi:hypothetical protein
VPRASHGSGSTPAISNELASFEVAGFGFFASSRAQGERKMSTRTNVTKPKSLRPKMQLPEVDLGFRWGLLNTVLLAAGVALLVAGYLSLSRGSITMAPVLLVTGYCVFIPASLLVRGGGSAAGE